MSDADTRGGDEKATAALSAMYQSEISANIGELQATTTIVLGLLAYLAGTIFFIDELTTALLSLLPLGVVFGCAYQMLRAAVVVRRAALARAYERRLAELAGFVAEYDRGELGSPFYGSLDDLGLILDRRGPGWVPRAVVAVIAYFGLYALSVLYTLLVIAEVWRQGGATWASVMGSLGYFVLWSGLAAAAVYLFDPKKPAALSPPKQPAAP